VTIVPAAAALPARAVAIPSKKVHVTRALACSVRSSSHSSGHLREIFTDPHGGTLWLDLPPLHFKIGIPDLLRRNAMFVGHLLEDTLLNRPAFF
jgi:hypothetical protein